MLHGTKWSGECFENCNSDSENALKKLRKTAKFIRVRIKISSHFDKCDDKLNLLPFFFTDLLKPSKTWKTKSEELPIQTDISLSVCLFQLIAKSADQINYKLSVGWNGGGFNRRKRGPPHQFVWGTGIEILPLLHYFQHTWKASSTAAERKLLTMFLILPFSTFLFWSITSLSTTFNTTSVELVFHSSLQDLPSIPLYFWLLSP